MPASYRLILVSSSSPELSLCGCFSLVRPLVAPFVSLPDAAAFRLVWFLLFFEDRENKCVGILSPRTASASSKRFCLTKQ